jgi:flagellin-like protein
MNVEKFRKKKAISPILATVILIAITLIAAVAIAGFVFGLFGSFTASARVSVISANCAIGPIAAPTYICSLSFSNTGNAATTITGCSFTGAGGGLGTLDPLSIPIAAGATESGTCTAGVTLIALAPSAGTSVSGSASLGNGGSALFAATWE